MKRLLVLLLLNVVFFQAHSQCFQIQTILVDACAGSQEGQNEMVTFRVGSSALNTSNLSVNWPNNSWLGLTKNAGTASNVTTVNSTIAGCGLLKEPVGGVLPANAKVLLVTSTAWTPLAQSFANLTDTFYIIFQTAGNTAGHFANYQSGGGLRTLSMTFSTPSGCTDAVTYDRALLVNQSLVVGAQDGSAVEFTPSGAATYVNNGCQAPYSPFSVNAGPDKNTCAGSSQSFTASASGAYTSVNWSLGSGASGSFAPTNSLSTIYTPGAGETGTVKLYCTIIKSCGTQTITAKDSVNLSFLQSPLPVISASSNTLCSGQTSVLSYSLSNASSTGTINTLWSPSGITTPTLSVSSAGVYTLNVSNSCGNNSATYSISAIQSPSVSISANGPTQFCAGGNVILTATSNTGNYLWTGGATTQTISVNAAGSIVVTSSNACGSAQATQTVGIAPVPTLTLSSNSISLCSGQTATVQANTNTAVTYSWSTGASTNTVSLNAAGNYSVDVFNSCGNASQTVSVSIGTSPTISVSATQTLICSGQTTTLSGSGSSGAYSWSNGANTATISVSNSGLYTATVTNGCGSAVSSISITSLSAPTVTISTPAATLCAGQSATLTALNSNGTNFSWSTGDVTNTTIVNTSGVKTVTVSNACGASTASISIFTASLPVISVSSNTNIICPNETATLTVTGASAPYVWSNSSGTGSVVTTTGGTVSVSNTNICGTATQTINVNVVNLSAGLSANPTTGTLPLEVDFTSNSVGGSSYAWTFGNGNTANTQTVSTQTYNDAGNYTVYLTVSDGICFDMDSLVITVLNEEGTLYVPNAFTPNGDSINDVFRVGATNIKEFDIIIFDRWGLELYASNDINEGWNGYVNGKVVSDGTYFFLLKAKDIDNKEIKKQGTVTLFK